MGTKLPLSERERQRIDQGRQQGRSIRVIASELGCSPETVRKWWRRLRDEGQDGLRTRPTGRPLRGILSSFPLELVAESLQLKQTHPGWGAKRVVVELNQAERFRELSLPSYSRLAAFFKARCPECVAVYQPRPKRSEHACPATAVHEVWQLDSQENIRLQDGDIATLCSIRDPFGAAMLASRAFSVKRGKAWRKLTWEEVRQVLREGFTLWQILPESVWTDNEHALAGNAADPFPSRLTLWLAGLGIRHVFIRPHCPTDQAHIERNHRTLDNLAIDETTTTDLATLQQALDRERQVYNQLFPCQASDCAGRPPLVAHPALLQPRRPYRPEWEWQLFNLQQIYDFLAGIGPLKRKINAVGQVHLGGNRYQVGLRHAGKPVLVHFDAERILWVVSLQVDSGSDRNGEVLAYCPPKDLDFHSLTGLPDPTPSPQPQPIQLTLPCLIP
jgi:transposase-like protein